MARPEAMSVGERGVLALITQHDESEVVIDPRREQTEEEGIGRATTPGAYPPVQPVAFSCSLTRAARGATIERKRAGLALGASNLTLDGDV